MSRTPWFELDDAAPISLQSRLDAVARERAVLAVARALAERGLVEGTPMQRVRGDAAGRLEIARDDAAPRAVIRRADGAVEAFDPTTWLPLASDNRTSNAA